MSLFYIYKLEGKKAVICPSLIEWAQWIGTANCHVADEIIEEIRISTVFLGLDHNFLRRGDPLLFETMVFFPNGETGRMCRYFTWEEAEEGHKKIANLIRAEKIEAGYDTVEILAKVSRGLVKNG